MDMTQISLSLSVSVFFLFPSIHMHSLDFFNKKIGLKWLALSSLTLKISNMLDINEKDLFYYFLNLTRCFLLLSNFYQTLYYKKKATYIQ